MRFEVKKSNRVDLSTNLANYKYYFTFISKGDAIFKEWLINQNT